MNRAPWETAWWVAGLAALMAVPPPPSMADSNGRAKHGAPRFEFALIGDLPYDLEQEQRFNGLLEDLNGSRLAFVIHDGDFKSGGTVCSDEVFEARKALFDTSRHPFVFVPGDNDWTDCHRANNGSYDPIERLERLRALFFPTNRSLGGRTMRLTRQSDDPRYGKFVENARWVYGDVVFVTLNIPGSNNNLSRTLEADAEYAERTAANLAWLHEAFELARRESAAGVLVVIQANPGFELPPTDPNRTGYNDFLATLEAETLAWGKPVVLVHGDTHYFRVDKPLIDPTSGRSVEHFTRLETFGSPNVHWVRGVVDARDPHLFQFEPLVVLPHAE